MRIRPAVPADVEVLSRIALAAKASWGYSPSQLADWHAEIIVPAESLARWFTFVAESEGQAVAFAQVSQESSPWEFQALWVLPQHMHRGFGRALVRHAAAHAAARGQGVLAIDSDPNAEPFYLRCGARVVGQVPAPIEGSPNRVRPQLILATSAT
ncbi:MAG: GNAT family N-acetyltransferase [Gammaproteobacteria bacterium]|nr:GNAT family N-acetyltransferase [Gammaproteobacteria bacterium]